MFIYFFYDLLLYDSSNQVPGCYVFILECIRHYLKIKICNMFIIKWSSVAYFVMRLASCWFSPRLYFAKQFLTALNTNSGLIIPSLFTLKNVENCLQSVFCSNAGHLNKLPKKCTRKITLIHIMVLYWLYNFRKPINSLTMKFILNNTCQSINYLQPYYRNFFKSNETKYVYYQELYRILMISDMYV